MRTGRPKTVYDKDYILSRIEIDPTTGCWNWKGSRDDDGYGTVNLRTGTGRSHRLAYILWVGDPGRLLVLHTCDNPNCANPEHLFLGTHADNAADKVKKGRQAQGERLSKLSEVDVRAIRASSKTAVALAVEFGVCREHVSDIRCGKTWRHIL